MRKIYYYVIAVLVVLILGFSLKGRISGTKFNSQTWKYSDLNNENNWDLRWKMMNDLRNNNQLIGMNKTQIANLLGKPDDEVNNDYNYYLGMTGTGINTGNLIISFNANNKVAKIYVFQG